MKNVLSLINSLKPSELKLVRSYYAGNNAGADNRLREQLLTLALAKPDCTDDEAQRYLYNRKKDSAFTHLKQRLKNDILNVLLTQDSEMKFRSKYAQAVFNCRRALMHGEMLLSRGVYEEAIDVLLRAAEIAEKNELYAELVQIGDIYRTHLVMKEQGRDFAELSKRIDTSVLLLQKSVKAKFHHYELTVPGLYRATNGLPLNGSGKELLNNLRVDFEETRSPRIGFYYHISAIHYLASHGDYSESLNHSYKLLELVKSAPAFQSDSFVAGANMEIANSLIQNEKYEEAESHALVALDLFRKGMLNELLALEKLYYCYIRLGNFRKAGEMITRAFASSKINYNEFLTAKWWFFKAGLEFMTADYARALASLKNCDLLQRDKTGWMLGWTVLEVLCRIESNQMEWLEAKTESLRKIMQRYTSSCGTNCDARMEPVFKILRSLRRFNYEYSEVKEIEKEKFTLLAGTDRNYRWDPAGYELIRFDSWYENKMNAVGIQKRKQKIKV